MARLGQIIKTLNIGIGTAVEFLNKKGQIVEHNPSIKLSDIQESLLLTEFSSDKNIKEKSDKLLQNRLEKEKLVTVAAKGYEDEVRQENRKHSKKKPNKEVELSETGISKQEKEPKETVKIHVQQEKKQEDIVSEIQAVDTVEKPEIADKTEKEQPKEEILPQPIEPQQLKQEVAEQIVKTQEKESEQETKQEVKKNNKGSEKSSEKNIIDFKKKKSYRNEPGETPREEEFLQTRVPKLGAPQIVGKIDLDKIVQISRPIPKTKAEKRKEYLDRERQKRDAAERQRNEEHKKQKELRLKKQTEDERRRQEIQRQKKDKDKYIAQSPKKEEFITTQVPKLEGIKTVGKIDLTPLTPSFRDGRDRGNRHIEKAGDVVRPEDKAKIDINKKDKRRKIGEGRVEINDRDGKNKTYLEKKKRTHVPAINERDVNQSVKDTLARLSEGRKFNKKAVKHRHDKREGIRDEMQRQAEMNSAESKIIKLTEFVTANELATMMQITVIDLLSTCMKVGVFASINQRLDAEIISLLANEYGYETEFVSADVSKSIQEEEQDKPEDLVPRPPIVTVMGHVDHGKTSLLDYIRKTNVIAGEAGGITQHIGAYNVVLEDGRHITFLDTPGHEAFTAMRARGAKVTDIAIIIVAADDDVMPQTIEAINHAAAANVPIVFAINKIDKDGADPEKIKSTLANMNYLVESWGGKYQSQDISAKKGINVTELLEKVLLEAELLDLKANPNRNALGSVIELTKDKGRGNVVTLLVENGTLKEGDIVLAGYAYGRIRAMFNERNQRIKIAGPSEPVAILGMKGELQAGDKFNVMNTEAEARGIISQRDQLKREQKLRTATHLTLDEIGRRIAMGNFQELNIIVKGDVDGSIEALSDSLIKLSTSEIKVNIIHKAVGQITEGDVNLAITSNAIIVGFQVRPTTSAKHLAEREEVDIRLYSIIYQAIEEVRAAMEGMLIPEKSEKIMAMLEVRNTFHISKVGTIAGCMVKDGKIKRNSRIRLIRDGIVICTGEIASLKHEKDDVREINAGYECGLNISNFNDIQIGDMIEAFEEIEIKKTL